MLLAVAIVGTLASIALPRLGDIRTEGLYTAASGEIRRMEGAILGHLAANRTLPATLAELNLDGMLDPWGRPYVYTPHYLSPPASEGDIMRKPPGARRDKFYKPLNPDFDLYSLGPDGDSKPGINKPPSRDDVIRAVGGAYVGKAEDF